MSNQFTTPIPISERFWPKVDRETDSNGCWPWIGSRNPKGYGTFFISGKRKEGAHRVSYKLIYGDIPKGQCVLHRCDNPPCVNPSHLFLGSPADNTRDALTKGRLIFQTNPNVFLYGDHHPQAKLNSEQVKSIRSLYDNGTLNFERLADQFHVNPSTIARIIKGKLWRKEKEIHMSKKETP